MLKIFLENMNPIKILVLISFLIGSFFLDKRKRQGQLLFYILVCGLITEYGVIVLMYFHKKWEILYSVSFIVHNTLWLIILGTIYKSFKYSKYIIISYVVFSVFNLLFIEGIKTMNSLTFIVGALLYLSFFVYINYIELKKENLVFFLSNDYLLIFIPTLLFIGLSMMFGFMQYSLFNVEIYPGCGLYPFICHLSDLNYYLLAIVYIYRVKKTEKKWTLLI